MFRKITRDIFPPNCLNDISAPSGPGGDLGGDVCAGGVAVGIDWDGRRQILAAEMAARESRSAWKDLLVKLKGRGLRGVELVV